MDICFAINEFLITVFTRKLAHGQTLALKKHRVLGLVFGFSTQTQTQTQKSKKPKIQTQTQTQNTKKFGSKNPKTQNFLGLKTSKIKFYG
jgi:hypothetical protein